MTNLLEQPGSSNWEQTDFRSNAQIHCQLEVPPIEAAAAALLRLWQERDLGTDPLVFLGPRYARHRQHQAYFLDTMVERRKEPAFEHLVRWQRFTSPVYARGIADSPLAGPLRKMDYLQEATAHDRNAVSAPVSGWYSYDFVSGWTALSVMLPPDHDGDAPATITALPQGRQDEWLAFLEALGMLQNELLHRDRSGLIDVLGGESSMADCVRDVTFDDVILPEEILEQVAGQRRIFEPSLLARYASFRIARMRTVLLTGPPGTGKTTLLKAEAAQHARNGGYVLYVLAAKKAGHSWENLSFAMHSAADSQLPTMILVEDFEQFVSDDEDLQQVLNTLDGIATPDNVAGTLLLATTNAPEKIDPRIKDRPGRIDSIIHVGPIEREDLVVRFLQRFLADAYCEEEHAPVAGEFLKQPGTHLREVCLLAAIHALDASHERILAQDLRWANDTILHGRAIAGQPERFLPLAPRTFLGLGKKK